MRLTLGDGYVEALRGAWPDMPESADFVMFWWDHAARDVRSGKTRQFGFITTNSLRQTFNRRVVEKHLHPKTPSDLSRLSPSVGERLGERGTVALKATVAPSVTVPLTPTLSRKGRGGRTAGVANRPALAYPALHLTFAIPDHPWVDNADGAAVRIAMTVGAAGDGFGTLQTVISEAPADEGEFTVQLTEQIGTIHADLTIGADIVSAQPLAANANLSNRGVQLFGAGFIVTEAEAAVLLPLPRGEGWGEGDGVTKNHRSVIREYRNGRDLTDAPRGVKVIDLFGLTANEVRSRYPAIYQHVVENVKPERDQNARATYRNNLWIHGEPRKELRASLAGLVRYIATVETSKHRTFQFLDASILPDNMLVAIASDSATWLGVLSSRVHIIWALATGGTLEDRPRYNKSRCFETFPFPTEDTGLTPALRAKIAELAEAIDAHRKRVLASGQSLTLTGLYNVLEALREGRVLTPKEKAIHDGGLVAVLKSLHDELDAAVLAAYGWADITLPRGEQTLLERLVALNAERVDREAAGNIAYLRPAYQDPVLRGKAVEAVAEQITLAIDTRQPSDAANVPGALANRIVAKARKVQWPRSLPERMKAVAMLLAGSAVPMTTAQVASRIDAKANAKSQLPDILATLVALGRAQQVNNSEFAAV